MNVYDFNGDVIVSRQEATESKDAIFSSFFDLTAIRSICNNYGPEFAHNMLMLPGLKYVRLTGTLKKLVPAETCRVTSSPTTPTQRATAQATGHLKNEIKGHQNKAHSLQAELRELLKKRKDYILQNNVKELKKNWIHRRHEPLSQRETRLNQQLYEQIQQIKMHKAGLNARIRGIKESISTGRTRAYLKRKQLT
ncbi:hypothetical protein RMATCC62417_08073 [Rhizopus microsporus]|nr:hypothetical protein RMATCC62417_08073 [Rhizopus microsporus]